MKFRKKPVVIDAMCWDGKCFDLFKQMAGDARHVTHAPDGSLLITTLEGEMRADIGDWVIKGVKGELYPCKPDIFVATYEPV